MRYFIETMSSVLNYDFCGNLLRNQDFIHHKRNINTNVFILMKEGTLYINQNGTNYVLGPNQYILLKANEEHYGYRESPGKISYLWAHFHPPDNEKVISDQADLNRTIESALHDQSNMLCVIPEIGSISSSQRPLILFNQLLDFSSDDTIYSKLTLDYALSLLMMEISKEFIESHDNIDKKTLPNIALIKEWIRSNYYIPLTIQDIASEFGYNPDYLSALFKKSTGTTLINFINKTKIEMSKPILSNYDATIKEAAYTCGFTDEKYYMKIFKKFEGMTPTQYRSTFMRKYIT